MKIIDKIVGKLAVYCCLSPGPANKPLTFNSFLLIRPGGIGDAVLLSPFYHILKNSFPEASIDILAEKRNYQVFSLISGINRVFLYDNPWDLLAVFRTSYDVVIDTEQWHRLSAVVARLTRAPLLIGYSGNERKKLFNYPISYSHDDYEIESLLKLLEPLGLAIPNEISLPFLEIPFDAAARAEELLGDYYGHHFVAIFPGASITERRWGAEKFRDVAKSLHVIDIPVVVVGGTEDAVVGDIITSGSNGLNLAGKTTLAETAALIEKAAVLVSGDSGILHIGVGLGKPTVSLFGPGIEKKWAPRGDYHIVINKCLPCSPCTKFGYTPKCPLNARCLAEITVEEVASAVESLLLKFGVRKN